MFYIHLHFGHLVSACFGLLHIYPLRSHKLCGALEFQQDVCYNVMVLACATVSAYIVVIVSFERVTGSA